MLKDPYIILALDRKTTDEEVRKAYLEAIRICPPEKDAKMFQQIQSAYDAIKTHRQRLQRELFNYQLPSPEDLIAQAASNSTMSPQRPSLANFQALLHRSTKEIFK